MQLHPKSRESLNQHIQRIAAFYAQHGLNPTGGFHQSLRADGHHRDPGTHHLVSSCRITVNFARAALLNPSDEYTGAVHHGLEFLANHHWREDGRGFHWMIQDDQVLDTDQYTYGYAFVLLTYASAVKLGIDGARQRLDTAYQLMQATFWDDTQGLFADQLSLTDGLSAYRGQNANMHACEALIQVFEATGERDFLDQALRIAHNITVRQTQGTGGDIWEHYQQDWTPDFDYNRDDPKNLYKPWGYQPGHFTEWAKLLLILDHHTQAGSRQPWLAERANWLLERAWTASWDANRGGLYYGFAPDGHVCDDDKYFWVQAESMAAYAIAAQRLGGALHTERLAALADYTNAHFVIQPSCVWHRVLSADNHPMDEWVALPGAKCDYHTLGAFWDILQYGSA